MDLMMQNMKTPSPANDFEYRRTKAFQSVSNGTLTNLMLLLDGVDDDTRRKLLTSRNDRAVVLRRPSTARSFKILNPTLLASACAEWYLEIVEFLAGEEHGMDETVSVFDESNDIVNYNEVSPLCIATVTGKFKIVQILYEHGADINQQNSIGNSPLFEACFEGHISIVNYLVQKGANIELANQKRVTCLMIASYANNWEIVKILTNLGANVNKRDKNERNALFYCLPSGGVAVFKLLRQSGATLMSDVQGMTVLMEAAYYGQLELVKWLLTNKTHLDLDPIAVDKKGRNVLFYCAEAGNVEVFQYVISHGIPVKPALDGSTILMMAALRGRHQLMDYLQKNATSLGLDVNTRDDRGRNCLFYCVSGNDISMLQKLVKFGAKVECTFNGVSLLQQAAVKGELNFGQYLLDNAVDLQLDIQSRDQDGWNALFFAIASGNLQLLKLLHEHGVKPTPSNDGRTLLMQAALRGQLEVLRHILSNQLKYQSDINATDKSGKSALYMSLQGENYADVFNILLDRGAQINRTKSNSTILMETVKVTSNLDVIGMLIKTASKLGLTLNDQDDDGRNVLFYAALNGNRDVMEYLLSLGVTLTNDVTNRTVMMVAAENGKVELLRLLVNRHRDLFLSLDHRDSLGRNVLFSTIEGGHLACFRILTEAGVKCSNDETGASVLMLLAGTSHREFLEFVVKNREELKVDLQSRDRQGDNAVHYALKHKCYENILYLVDEGCELVRNGRDESVVSKCVEDKVFWVVEKLATNGVDLTDDLHRKDGHGIPYFHHLLTSGMEDALLIALIEIYFDEKSDADSDGVTITLKSSRMTTIVLNHLVEATNVNVNVKDYKGRNALYHAVEATNLANVKYLLSYGATFDNDVTNRTPLMACAENSFDNSECLHHLLRYVYRDNESRNVTDGTGQSVLHYSIKSGNVNATSLVLDYNVDLERSDNNGLTPFLLAAKLNQGAIIDLLIAKGANVLAVDNQSRTALHLLFETEGSTLTVTKSLIGRGCDVNARELYGRTPLMLAAKQDNLRPIKYLLESGADVTLRDYEHHDALDYCPDDHQIIRVLLSKYKGEPIA